LIEKNFIDSSIKKHQIIGLTAIQPLHKAWPSLPLQLKRQHHT
jgi:hypothetical protein